MTRTDDDLRAVFDTIAAEADLLQVDIDDSVQRPRRIRRLLVPLAVAAALAGVVAVGAVIGTHRSTQRPDVATTPAPAVFRSDATLGPLPAGAIWAETLLQRGSVQSFVVDVAAVAGADVAQCVLTTGADQAPPGPFTVTGSTTVGSQPAQLGVGDPLATAADPDAPRWVRVRWQPAEGRWADAVCAGETGEVPLARRLATSLRWGGASFGVPWTASSLPYGLVVGEVSRQPRSAGAPRVSVSLYPGLGPSPRPPGARDLELAVFVTLESLDDYVESNGPLARHAERLADIDGRQLWVDPAGTGQTETQLIVVDGATVFELNSERGQEDLRAVLTSLSLAPELGRESTWAPVSDLPW